MILLDTHVLLWWLTDDPRLGRDARAMIRAERLAISPASLWEIAIKVARRRLPIDLGRVIAFARDFDMVRLPVSDAHFLRVQSLPQAGHADPFDRLIIAQSLVEAMPILTSDAKFQLYDVEIIDARS